MNALPMRFWKELGQNLDEQGTSSSVTPCRQIGLRESMPARSKPTSEHRGSWVAVD